MVPVRMKRTYPEMPLVGVGALVIRDGKILLVKRKYPPGKGRWSIPGGHVEVDESILEAARRELLEETGIEGDPLGVVNVDDAIIYDDDGKIKYRYVLVTVLLRARSDKTNPGSDALDARFYDLREALNLELTDSTRGLIWKILNSQIPLDKPCPVNRYSPNYANE